MAITVYWACLEDEWMAASEPENVYKKIVSHPSIEKNNNYTRIDYCPAIQEKNKNTFELKSIYSYNFSVNNGQVYTDKFDEVFFKKHVIIRSLEKKMFSFGTKYIFFTDEPSLMASFYEAPFLETNNITKNCSFIPGTFDIGKWFRNTEFAFYLKDNVNTFVVEKNEVFSYVTFLTDQKINFVQFAYNPELDKMLIDGQNLVSRYGHKKLSSYYKMFKNKKRILKQIKESLV
jgi:hypothetical protein